MQCGIRCNVLRRSRMSQHHVSSRPRDRPFTCGLAGVCDRSSFCRELSPSNTPETLTKPYMGLRTLDKRVYFVEGSLSKTAKTRKILGGRVGKLTLKTTQ
jgi:hypothetical protein